MTYNLKNVKLSKAGWALMKTIRLNERELYIGLTKFFTALFNNSPVVTTGTFAFIFYEVSYCNDV